jgi:hypothetical protein
MHTHGFGILMVLGSAVLAFGLAVAVIASQLRGRPVPVARLALVAGGWAALYGASLLTLSLGSRGRVLAWDEDLRFCGFYLDCHLRVAVTGVEIVDSIAGARPEGRFHVVTLRIGSDAKAARLRLHDPRLTVTDAAGRRFDRTATAEAALGPRPALTDEVGPGAAYATTVVFDLPRDAGEPRLAVTHGWWADRLIEFILIGDEDSFLHARTTIRLTP